MKVIFFSEGQTIGKVPRDFKNARTEYAWSIALDAEWCPINTKPRTNDFDLGIVIIPKNNPEVDISYFKKYCNKVAVMQEGPHWYFQDYTIEQQFKYFNSLMEQIWNVLSLSPLHMNQIHHTNLQNYHLSSWHLPTHFVDVNHQ